ncbi:MAG: hypothetical protein L6R35_007567 [Caloplaca aegaea]|nr:MAG: hypothetical protein L6R35_007567 [Caloplaca aegaea]
MFLEDLGIDSGDGVPVATNPGVGNDEIKLVDALRLNGSHGRRRVALALVVNLDDDDPTGRIFGDGRELLRGRMIGIAHSSNDNSIRSGEVNVNKAGTNACVVYVSVNGSRSPE